MCCSSSSRQSGTVVHAIPENHPFEEELENTKDFEFRVISNGDGSIQLHVQEEEILCAAQKHNYIYGKFCEFFYASRNHYYLQSKPLEDLGEIPADCSFIVSERSYLKGTR